MQESIIQWPLGLDGKDLVGAGVTAIFARLDAVVKVLRAVAINFWPISCVNLAVPTLDMSSSTQLPTIE